MFHSFTLLSFTSVYLFSLFSLCFTYFVLCRMGFVALYTFNLIPDSLLVSGRRCQGRVWSAIGIDIIAWRSAIGRFHARTQGCLRKGLFAFRLNSNKLLFQLVQRLRTVVSYTSILCTDNDVLALCLIIVKYLKPCYYCVRVILKPTQDLFLT